MMMMIRVVVVVVVMMMMMKSEKQSLKGFGLLDRTFPAPFLDGLRRSVEFRGWNSCYWQWRRQSSTA